MDHSLAILPKNCYYLFALNDQGESPLLSYLNSKLPQDYPPPTEFRTFTLDKILRDLDLVITLESQYDPTNWEILRFDGPLQRIFNQPFLHYKALYHRVLDHLILAHPSLRGETNQTIVASWMVQEPKPVIQQICSLEPQGLQGRFYLSGDLCRIFRQMGKRAPDEKRYHYSHILKTVIGFLEANPQIKDPKDPLIYRVGSNALSRLGDTSILHHSQLEALVQYHCRKEQYYAPKICCNCNGLLGNGRP